LEKGLRTAPVTVVDGQTSSIGTVQLEDAPVLKVNLRDPYLPIQGAKIRLREIPTVELATDDSGYAYLPCVPHSGCYNADANTKPYNFDIEQSPCPKNDDEWESGIRLLPDQKKEWIIEQIHNAYSRLDIYHSPLESCTTEQKCRSTEWNKLDENPPCALGIDGRIPDELEISDLANTVAAIRNSRILSSYDLKCPPHDDSMFNCMAEKCELAMPGYTMMGGLDRRGCFTDDLHVSPDQDNFEVIISCLGFPDEIFDEGYLHVFYAPCTGAESPILKYLRKEPDSNTAELYYEIGWKSTLTGDTGQGTCAWSLYRIDFVQAGMPEEVTAAVAWIRPL